MRPATREQVITAMPSQHDGFDTILRPTTFRTAVYYRLGVPIPATTPVNEIAKDGLRSPVLEKKGILGNAPGRRPGDVTIPLWESGRALALDIAVTSSVNASNVESKSPCEAYAQYRKVRQGLQGQRDPYLRHPRVEDVRSDQQRGRSLPAPTHVVCLEARGPHASEEVADR